MKVKLSLIPFGLISVAMIALKMMSLLSLDDNGLVFGMDKIMTSYAVIGGALGIFVFSVLFNIFDRDTAPVYEVSKNPVAGVMACLSAVLLSGVSLFDFLNLKPTDEYYFMAVIIAAAAIPAAIALFIMCMVHFSGKTTVNSISILYVFPCLWACAQLISDFLTSTRISVNASDMTSMFCYIFLTLYLFSYSMIISRIKGRNPVKACYIYGLPAVALCLSYGAYIFGTTLVEEAGRSNLLIGGMFIALGIYALSFIIEMSFNLLSNDAIKIVDGTHYHDKRENEDEELVSPDNFDELVFSKRNSRLEDMEKFKRERKGKGETEEKKDRPTSKDLDDFVIGFNSKDARREEIQFMKNAEQNANGIDSIITVTGNENRGDDIAPVVDESVIDTIHDIVQADDSDEKKKTKVEKKPVDEIDMLLQELESKK